MSVFPKTHKVENISFTNFPFLLLLKYCKYSVEIATLLPPVLTLVLEMILRLEEYVHFQVWFISIPVRNDGGNFKCSRGIWLRKIKNQIFIEMQYAGLFL